MPIVTPRKVDKPWGHELIWAHTDRYVGKILHIKQGHRLSLQYHNKKDETLYVRSGRLLLIFGTGENLTEKEMTEGECFHIPPFTRHRMVAVTDCEILETSTTELDDVVRLEDAYGRAGTSRP